MGQEREIEKVGSREVERVRGREIERQMVEWGRDKRERGGDRGGGGSRGAMKKVNQNEK